MANETVELYYKGKPINPNRDLPTRTYAEAQAEGLTSSDKLWVRKDAPQSDLIVDNLTTDDSARALSAKQGKVLNDDTQTTAWEQLATADTRKIYVRRSGHVVELYYWTDSKFANETTLATLPTKYRPTTPDYPQVMYVRDSINPDSPSTSSIKIENGGAIKITANYEAWKQYNATWIV